MLTAARRWKGAAGGAGCLFTDCAFRGSPRKPLLVFPAFSADRECRRPPPANDFPFPLRRRGKAESRRRQTIFRFAAPAGKSRARPPTAGRRFPVSLRRRGKAEPARPPPADNFPFRCAVGEKQSPPARRRQMISPFRCAGGEKQSPPAAGGQFSVSLRRWGKAEPARRRQMISCFAAPMGKGRARPPPANDFLFRCAGGEKQSAPARAGGQFSVSLCRRGKAERARPRRRTIFRFAVPAGKGRARPPPANDFLFRCAGGEMQRAPALSGNIPKCVRPPVFRPYFR